MQKGNIKPFFGMILPFCVNDVLNNKKDAPDA